MQADENGERYGWELSSFLGCRVERDWDANTISLSMPAKIDGLPDMVGMSLFARQPGDTQCVDEPYSNVCGSALFIGRAVRPDIMQRASELARHMHGPTSEHWQAAKRLLAYVKGTRDEKLVYKHDPNVNADNFSFVGYVDADHGSDLVNRKLKDGPVPIEPERNFKATMGWVFTQNDAALSWRSRKSPIATDSTSASEFVAAADASKQAVCLRRLYGDFGYPQYEPMVLHEDNESCCKLVRNYCGHDKIKHLDIRASIVREHHSKGFVDISHLSGQFQLADVFTKVFPGPQQREMREWLLRGVVPQGALDCGDLRRPLAG